MVNSVILVGRLVADPELKYTPNGIAVCSFRIAVNRRFKNESGEREADFFTIVAWRQTAEFVANYMSKGRLIAVEGRLQSRSWTDQNGQRRSVVEVSADNVTPLESRNASGGGNQQSGGYNADSAPAAQPRDDGDYDPFSEE